MEGFLKKARSAGFRTECLERALSLSTAAHTHIRQALEKQKDSGPLDVVALGSAARFELTAESDFDFVVMAYGICDDVAAGKNLLNCARAEVNALRYKPPGSTGLFGAVVSAPDMVERIGLDQDSNANHTRRILLLQESQSLMCSARHKGLLQAIIGRYLADYPADGKEGVPRFLLNDFLRYWRTLAVDYQAKKWRDGDSDWGLRYLKLLISRKIGMAATLYRMLSLERANVQKVYDIFARPPLARFEPILDTSSAFQLKTVVETLNDFVEKLTSEGFRSAMKEVDSKVTGDASPEFKVWRERAKEVHETMLKIFFENDEISETVKRYLLL